MGFCPRAIDPVYGRSNEEHVKGDLALEREELIPNSDSDDKVRPQAGARKTTRHPPISTV